MQSRAIEALNNGRSVVYDSTNMTRKDRSYIISLCPKFAKIEAHIIWTPIETCIERDAARERTVGKEIIDRMLKRFQAPYYDESIDDIRVIWPDDFDSITYRLSIANDMKIPHDNPHHTLEIQLHCYEAGRYAYQHFNGDIDLMTAAMWHDVGKPYVKSFVDSKGNPCENAHFYNHQCVGSWLSYGLVDVDSYIAWLISVHMDPFLNTKYYNKLPNYLKKRVDQLHECDVNAH